jgi:hypothetical protein
MSESTVPALTLPAGAAGSRIVGLGHHQPEKALTNDDIARFVETNDEWIRSRTGIVTRHVAADDVTVADMATAAAQHALDDAGIAGTDVDLVVVATTTATDRSPNTAGRVAYALRTGVQPGASTPEGEDEPDLRDVVGPGVVDVNTACSGFAYAVGIADQAIRAGSARTAVVVGSEKLTSVTDWTDRSTCILTAAPAGGAGAGGPAPAAPRPRRPAPARGPPPPPGQRIYRRRALLLRLRTLEMRQHRRIGRDLLDLRGPARSGATRERGAVADHASERVTLQPHRHLFGALEVVVADRVPHRRGRLLLEILHVAVMAAGAAHDRPHRREHALQHGASGGEAPPGVLDQERVQHRVRLVRREADGAAVGQAGELREAPAEAVDLVGEGSRRHEIGPVVVELGHERAGGRCGHAWHGRDSSVV